MEVKTINPHQEAARIAKAQKLASILKEFEIPVSDVDLISDQHWQNVALIAGCNPPSAETIAVVKTFMKPAPKTVRFPRF